MVEPKDPGRERSLSFSSDMEEVTDLRRNEVLLRQRRHTFGGAKKWMTVAWDLLDQVKNHSKSYPFHKPVDP